jgi:hypothetical protein
VQRPFYERPFLIVSDTFFPHGTIDTHTLLPDRARRTFALLHGTIDTDTPAAGSTAILFLNFSCNCDKLLSVW